MKNFYVINGNEKVGKLHIEEGETSFSYESSWILKDNAFPLSPKIKLGLKEINGVMIKSFFENLLPEEANLEAVARLNKIETNDLAELLAAFGKEAAGAVQIYEEKEFNEREYDPHYYKEIPLKALSEYLDTGRTAASFIEDELGLRPSMAGAQDKIACVYDQEKKVLKFPTKGGATTHILKPAMLDKERFGKDIVLSALNEFFIMKVAQKIWPSVPTCHFIEEGKRDIYVVERYDRYLDLKNEVIRLHQFDFCQYFGLPSQQKYQEKGGKNFLEILTALGEESYQPAIDRSELINWLIYNFYVGNNDSHAKNVSMLYEESGNLRLAPFYDLNCTTFFTSYKAPVYSERFAFKIGDFYKNSDIADTHWKAFAKQIGLNEMDMMNRLYSKQVEIIKAINNVEKELASQLSPEKLKGLQKISKHLFKRFESLSLQFLKNTHAFTECKLCQKTLTKRSNKVIGYHDECLKKLV